MDALFCTSTASAVGSQWRSPLLVRESRAFCSEHHMSLPLHLAAAPGGAVSHLRRPGLGFSRISRRLLMARAASEDRPNFVFGQLGTASKIETEAVKSTTTVQDNDEESPPTAAEEVPTPPTAAEEVPTEEEPDYINFLNQLDLKLNSEDVYPVLIYGGGAFVALWISSAVVGAIDSLPLFPKVMEVIGLGFTIWFTYRYLIFKINRDELFEKIEDLKKQILGPSVD